MTIADQINDQIKSSGKVYRSGAIKGERIIKTFYRTGWWHNQIADQAALAGHGEHALRYGRRDDDVFMYDNRSRQYSEPTIRFTVGQAYLEAKDLGYFPESELRERKEQALTEIALYHELYGTIDSGNATGRKFRKVRIGDEVEVFQKDWCNLAGEEEPEETRLPDHVSSGGWDANGESEETADYHWRLARRSTQAEFPGKGIKVKILRTWKDWEDLVNQAPQAKKDIPTTITKCRFSALPLSIQQLIKEGA